MAESPETTEKPSKKHLGLPLAGGILGSLLLGGGGFFAVYSGVLPGAGTAFARATPASVPAFVPVEPLVISLGPQSRSAHLRLTAQLEVEAAHRAEVQVLMPRIMDVMNGYLHALEVRELEEPGALIRMRSQMLRRVQIVTGEGRVRDLLVTEFVFN